MKKAEFEKKVKTSIWTVTRAGGSTFINAGSICVGQVIDCVADGIAKAHNESLKK